VKFLLITDALHKAGVGGFSLHPSLIDLQSQLTRRRRQWFHCTDRTPLGWYAELVDTFPSALLAARCSDLPTSVRQGWVASPYHAELGRDTVRLMPEGELAWSEADASWLCGELNPLLGQEGMSLHACGAALLLACNTPMDVSPVSFAAIAGGLLPNRHPDGSDGGRLMRLLSEIQMSLHVVSHRTGQPTRDGQPDISGLWLWGACPLPVMLPVGLPPVATQNPFLQSLQHEHGAEIAISEADRVPDLIFSKKQPPSVLLAGAGQAVLLRNALLPCFAKGWKPESPAAEEDLLKILQEIALAT